MQGGGEGQEDREARREVLAQTPQLRQRPGSNHGGCRCVSSVTCWTIYFGGISWNASQVPFTTPLLCPKCPLGLPPSDEPRSKPQLPLEAGGGQTWAPRTPPHTHTLPPQHQDHGREQAGAGLRGTAAWAWRKPLPSPLLPGFERRARGLQFEKQRDDLEPQPTRPDAIDSLSTSRRVFSESGSAGEFCQVPTPSESTVVRAVPPGDVGDSWTPPGAPTWLEPGFAAFWPWALSPFASTVVTV